MWLCVVLSCCCYAEILFHSWRRLYEAGLGVRVSETLVNGLLCSYVCVWKSDVVDVMMKSERGLQ